MANLNYSEAQTLEQFRVALENVENQPKIATIMAEFGYDETLIAEGKALWTTANTAYLSNKTEDDETTEAYANFTRLKEEVMAAYKLHRKKAKVIFRKDELTADKLSITGILPKAYVKWLETIEKFYTVAIAEETIKTKLARLKITADELDQVNVLIFNMKAARAEYLREKGESQDATKVKDQALANLDDWMSEFYAVAEIALEDNPQLLESLSKVVKS